MFLTIISLLIFVVYLFFAIKRYSIPTSLSETYYLLGGEPFNRLKASIFTLMMWAISFTLLPAMLDLTPDGFQFITFLALASICFVGAAPNFKEQFEGKVHTTSAIIAAALGLLWVILITKFWYIPLISGGTILLLGLITKSLKYGKTFWLEMIAFLSVYSAAILTAL